MVDLTNIFFLLLDTESVTKIISEKVSVITINNMIILGRVSKLCAVAVNLHLPVCLFVWTCATHTVCTFPQACVHVEMFRYLFVWTFATHS